MHALNKISINQDVFFILLIVSFFLISLLKGIYPKHARLLFKSVYAQRYANQYLREENAFTERVNVITFLLMSINFTLIISKLLLFSEWASIFLTLLSVVFFFLIKIGVLRFLGFIFRVQSLSKLAVFFSLLFDRVLGVLLFPIVIFLCFFSFDISLYATFCLVMFSIILFGLKLFWFWKIGTNSFGLPSFYIFLYLCTLEIFPILVLAKEVFY
tara:strand:- start:13775 stop:14416 length:642 start_codon:yes stop_codon:yes gene_type:complete